MTSRRPYWRDALMQLHVRGWDTDDIDSACEAIVDACLDRELSGITLDALEIVDIRNILEVDVVAIEAPALVALARTYADGGSEARALREALFDLDAFAYAYAGDD